MKDLDDRNDKVVVPPQTPLEVFYVIRTNASRGERSHRLCSPLYETRPQAQTELDRLQREDAAGVYSIWKSETYIEPAEWLHRVVRADGSLIMPRLSCTRSGDVDA